MTQSPATPLPPPGERRRLRESRSLTQAQLARRVGVSRETVRAWESGRTAPRGRKGEAYAKLLITATTAPAKPGPTGPLTPTETTRSADSADSAESPEISRRSAESPTRSAAGRAGRGQPSWSVLEEVADPAALTPAQAFDALYAFCAPALVRQTYLLSGRRDLARESVERAFQLAWERWPEVARDRDPAGWVRAASYEWALAPWHRFRPRYRHPEPPPSQPFDRALLDVLLHLPPPHRRALVLYDGVGLDLPETAAETEASTPATANRLLHAHATLAARLPELSDPLVLHRRLAELAATEHLRSAKPPEVRDGSERRARFRTRAAVAFTVALIGATALTLCTAPTRYDPPVPPGETVRGVPPRVAPGPLSGKERELRTKLREELLHGPERLAPQSR
ncbi:helix-turn-helix domain-containing protein [Streptomyces sp. KMM 9044]|uniref:helix-turn-helix domain-containing protein n=1 Tax=Streptomyces sp. KMM 9044 TaxID=2744474 RepID=UPI002151E18F|nr:helix-turn-helix domain-containing protein [Streptomyces sp. KMM 9044]WAX78385.1 helix-turn-helix domain-containing protein [Streptomyces sp. KMM 9044]